MNYKTIKIISIKILRLTLLTFLLLACYLILSSEITGSAPQLGDYQFTTVLTGSMSPTIKQGSLIIIKAVNDPNVLSKGDVITFYSPRDNSELITHRIVDLGTVGLETYYKTKGDQNSTIDARMVSYTKVIGKYQNIHIPFVGYFIELTKTKVGYILFFVLPVLILMITNLRPLLQIFKRSENGGVVRGRH